MCVSSGLGYSLLHLCGEEKQRGGGGSGAGGL